CSAIAPDQIVLKTTPVSSAGKLGKLTWRLGVEHDLAPRAMVYVNVSTGFKSGGVNSAPTGIQYGIPPTYDPETITAYQAGMKTRFFDNRLQFNGEVFWYDYKGYQTLF